MEILSKILGSAARVKIMRLFLLNRGKNFKSKEVGKRSRVSAATARKEIRLLGSVGFIKKRGELWSFNSNFKYANEFEDLLLSSNTLTPEEILENFKKVGKVKLILAAGRFIRNPDSRVDILLVGDRLKKKKIEEGVKKIEAEIGVELVYAIFETKEFVYRLNMYDKLVRDILDFPHEVILQSKELSTQVLRKL